MSEGARDETDALARCVGAIVDVLIDESRPDLPPCDRRTVADYVRATLAAMPDHFRLGFRLLALAFDITALPAHGHRFSRLAPAERRAHLEAWRGSPLGFRRSMIAFYTTFACYGLYSLPRAQDRAPVAKIAA